MSAHAAAVQDRVCHSGRWPVPWLSVALLQQQRPSHIWQHSQHQHHSSNRPSMTALRLVQMQQQVAGRVSSAVKLTGAVALWHQLLTRGNRIQLWTQMHTAPAKLQAACPAGLGGFTLRCVYTAPSSGCAATGVHALCSFFLLCAQQLCLQHFTASIQIPKIALLVGLDDW
jgi:hypothetical protein